MQFKDVIGQQEIKESLIKSVNSNQIPHAILMLGELGRGGFALTLAYIQFLMCENRTEDDSCGNCSSCSRIAALEHPDIHFTFPTVQAIAKTSDELFPLWKSAVLENPYLDLFDWILKSDEKGRKPIISVHQGLSIIKKLNLTAFEGGKKISILWYAEEMNADCANKLLKIIEEPPKDTIFILIAASESNILPTILSRTQIVKIPPINEKDIMSFLEEHETKNSELNESVAIRSEGNFGKVLQLYKVEEENNNFSRFVSLMRLCYKKEVKGMLDWAEAISALGKEDQKQFILYALFLLRQCLISNYTEGKLSHTSTEESKFLVNFSRFITGNNITSFYQLMDESYYHIERNANVSLLFTNITFEVMRYIHRA